MTANTFITVPIANGVTIVPLAAGSKGQLELTLRGAAPSAGTLKVEGLQWTGAYVTLGGASAIDLAAALAGGATLAITEHGHFSALRFTLSSVTGGAGALGGSAYFADSSIADLAFQGQRALTTQSFTEAQTKLGNCFYFQKMVPTMAANSTYNIVVTTGALPVLIKDRSIYTLGQSIGVQLFKAPTGVTGGSAIPVQNYNDIAPVASTVTVTGGATVTTPGTAWGDPVHVYGASQQGNRQGANIAPGGDRVLSPNKSYLIQIVNSDTQTALVDYYLTWYEAVPDLPRQ